MKEYVIIYSPTSGYIKKISIVSADSEDEARDIFHSKSKYHSHSEILDIREKNEKKYIFSFLDEIGFHKFAEVKASSEEEAKIKFLRGSRYRDESRILDIQEEAREMKKTEAGLPKGYYTLGDGHIHKIPTQGWSKWYKRGRRKYRYSYETKELVLYGPKYDDEGNEIRGELEEYDRIGLSFYNWVENPDYWVDQYNDDIDEMVNSYTP